MNKTDKINKMSSDVVRWFKVFSPSQHNNDNMAAHRSGNICRNRHQIAINTFGNYFSTTFILLTVAFVINQQLSLVLSERILATNNLNFTTKSTYLNNEQNQIAGSSDDGPVQMNYDVNDLTNIYRAHQIHVDDDILNDKHFTSTWAVHIPGGIEIADRVAEEHGFINLGKVSPFFLFLILSFKRR